MEPFEIIAQIIGIVAMLFNVLSYQGKKQSTVIIMQLFGAALFAVNFLMLGSIVGGVLNIIGVVRALVFCFKDKLKAESLPWFVGFIVVYFTVYVLNFTVFGKQPTALNLIVEILPVIGMIALNIGYRQKDASNVRKFGLVSSPSWLIYNIFAGSWGAILCESFTLASILIGIHRHDKKKI